MLGAPRAVGVESSVRKFVKLMPLRIGSIVIHTPEFERTVAFWQSALEYAPRGQPKGGWVVLQDPAGRRPNLSFQARDRRPRSRSWVHLDLYTADQDGEVQRLLNLG